jgi:Domain of unknown function (DUF4404)
MPEQPSANSNATAQVQAHLHIIALMLRAPHRFGPEAQAALADLVDELGKTLETPDVPSAEVARLSECAAQLAKAVHEEHEPGLLEAARNRYDHAVVAVESQAPTLAGLARRLAEMLSDVGI